MKDRWSSRSCLFLVSVALAGCLSFEKSYPEKRYFALSASRARPARGKPLDAVLAVRPLRVSPGYAGSEFVYRTGDVTLESDFYNEFFVPPGRLITEEVRRWFEASGVFETVVDSSSPLEATYFLEGAVQAIYGDYRPDAPPRAALEMQFFLLESGEEGVHIVLQKNFSRQVDIEDDTSAALVRGWNQALGDILAEFAGAVRSELAENRGGPDRTDR